MSEQAVEAAIPVVSPEESKDPIPAVAEANGEGSGEGEAIQNIPEKAAEPAKKRGRGRPPKLDANGVPVNKEKKEKKEKEKEQGNAPAKKRGRGRPPKLDSNGVPVNKEKKENKEKGNAPAKKRGRPPKAKTDGPALEKEKGATRGRKRGRPAKAREENDTVEPPKKRGRPPKDSAAKAPAKKAGPGRPKKLAASSARTLKPVSDLVKAGAPKKRGRPANKGGRPPLDPAVKAERDREREKKKEMEKQAKKVAREEKVKVALESAKEKARLRVERKKASVTKWLDGRKAKLEAKKSKRAVNGKEVGDKALPLVQGSQTPPAKKRGRPPKKKTDVDVAPKTDAPPEGTGAIEAAGDEDEGKEKAGTQDGPKKRGRPKKKV